MSPRDPAGELRLRPGMPLPNIVSTRPAVAGRVVRGLTVDLVPRLLAQIHALCGGAHEVAAQLALAAARGHSAPATPVQRAALGMQALREHLRRVWLDWPRLLGAEHQLTSDTLAPLRDLWRQQAGAGNAEQTRLLREWLAVQVFGVAPDYWLDRHAGERGDGLLGWLDTAPTAPARWLAGAHVRARELACHADAALPTSVAPALLAIWLGDWFDGRGRPDATWLGRTRETGCWTRSHPAGGANASALDRIVAKLDEIARLASAPGALAAEGHALAPGLGAAWVETARGMLAHIAEIDAGGRVLRYEIVSPTDWNFHPEGAAARALAALVPDARVAATDCALIAAAFDPCVAYVLEDSDA